MSANLDPVVAVLRHERLHKGLTQADLAAAAGITQAQISRIELGLQVPNLRTVHRIAAALGLNVVVFCTEHGVLGMPEHG